MICRQCNKETTEQRFATYRDRNGNLKRRGTCKDCRGKYHEENFERLQTWRKEYNQNNKQNKKRRDLRLRKEMREFVDTYKAKPCMDCSKQWPPVAMDLDHVRGIKSFSISSMSSRCYKIGPILLEELAKCDVVCACCHRLRTAARGQNLSPTEAQLGF